MRGYRDEDRDEVLRVNAAAFAHHPEQGSMDADDLAARMAEEWFDPAGLLVADAGAGLRGFHWTKQHSAELGEVYVVAIDPAAQGQGLGRVLTLAGLHHLHGLGVGEVLLYVESDNAPAVRVYERPGLHPRRGGHPRAVPPALTDLAGSRHPCAVRRYPRCDELGDPRRGADATTVERASAAVAAASLAPRHDAPSSASWTRARVPSWSAAPPRPPVTRSR